MEVVKDVKIVLYIETNERKLEKDFENLFDLKSFMDNFFLLLQREGLLNLFHDIYGQIGGFEQDNFIHLQLLLRISSIFILTLEGVVHDFS